jgi:putative ABC transport system ATP-binding protein
MPFAAPADNLMLRAENLGRSVPGKLLVDSATFGVAKGEILAIVGPSGSGKSSLLRLLNRLDEPTNGTVYLGNVDYRTIASRELRRRVGMVMQRPYLFPGTVERNLQFGPQQRGSALPQERVDELLGAVGLAGYATRDVANLSGGEAQRVSFARTQRALTCVLVTHDMVQAARLAQRALVLAEGRIIKSGTVEEVLRA